MIKKIFTAIFVFGILCAPDCFGAGEEYHMIEENSPAYSDAVTCRATLPGEGDPYLYERNHGNIDPSSPYWDEKNYYYRSDGSVVYTTRRKAIYHGFRLFDAGRGYAPDTGVYGQTAGYSTFGKNFYPNSNYKREVKKTQKKVF